MTVFALPFRGHFFDKLLGSESEVIVMTLLRARFILRLRMNKTR